MSHLSNAERSSSPGYTLVVFKKVGTYTNDQGELVPVLEAERLINEYQVSGTWWTGYLDNPSNSEYVLRTSRTNEPGFVDFADIVQRREDLKILSFLTSYRNAGEVRDADDFYPLEKQLHFPWKDLLANYRLALSEDVKENCTRLDLLELLYNYRTGNRHLSVQEYLDKTANGFAPEMKQASDYLRLFEAQGFIKITDFFTIVPNKVKEYYDSHFETSNKSGKW